MKPLLAIAGACAALPATAGPGAVTAFPANHVTLARAPDQVRLVFPEAVRVSDVQIRRSAKCAWALEPMKQEAATTVSLPLPPLLPGTYVVSWQRQGDDVRESTTFSIR